MTLGFLNIGTQEMILIVIVILLLFGGKKLPELARGLGRGIREFKDASEGIKREISDQINNFERDLDVTVEEDLPTQKEVQADETKVATKEESEVGQEVARKGFPGFTTPEHAMQHQPEEQPPSSEEHYTYGYNDHFAEEKDAAETSQKEAEPSDPKSVDSKGSAQA